MSDSIDSLDFSKLDKRVDWNEAVVIALNSFNELYSSDGCYFLDSITVCDKEYDGDFWTEVEVKITANRIGAEHIGSGYMSQMRCHSVLTWAEGGYKNKRGSPYSSCSHWFICSLDVTRAI